jgi:hypothetical protein
MVDPSQPILRAYFEGDNAQEVPIRHAQPSTRILPVAAPLLSTSRVMPASEVTIELSSQPSGKLLDRQRP